VVQKSDPLFAPQPGRFENWFDKNGAEPPVKGWGKLALPGILFDFFVDQYMVMRSVAQKLKNKTDADMSRMEA
jgi:hypothetical protein